MINKEILIIFLTLIILILVTLLIIIFYNVFLKYLLLKPNDFTLTNNMYKFELLSNRFHISKDNFDKLNNATNTLYVITHDYEHIDLFSIVKIFHNILKKKAQSHLIFYNAWWNKLLQWFYKKDFKSGSVLYTGSGLVDKSVNLLNQKNNVLIFKYKENTSTGIYHIAKLSKCNVVLVKIKCRKKIEKNHYNSSKLEVLLSYVNEDFDITIEDFDKDPVDSSEYLDKIKNSLYDLNLN